MIRSLGKRDPPTESNPGSNRFFTNKELLCFEPLKKKKKKRDHAKKGGGPQRKGWHPMLKNR